MGVTGKKMERSGIGGRARTTARGLSYGPSLLLLDVLMCTAEPRRGLGPLVGDTSQRKNRILNLGGGRADDCLFTKRKNA